MANKFIVRPSSIFGYVCNSTRYFYCTSTTKQNQLGGHAIGLEIFENGLRSPENSSFIAKVLQNVTPTDNSIGRLRILGGAFIRYAVTLHLYTNKEVELSTDRFHIEREKQLQRLEATIRDANISAQRKDYYVPNGLKKRFQALEIPQKYWNLAMIEDISEMSDGELRLLVQWKQSLGDKRKIARKEDNHALIGAYLAERGTRRALLVASWLGCYTLPASIVHQRGAYEIHFGDWLTPVVKPLIETDEWRNTLDHLLAGYHELENQIGYTFQNRLLLLQAVSHRSFRSNKLTHSNDRLAFLGDSIFLFLMAAYAFQHPEDFSQDRCHRFCSNLGSNLSISNAVVRSGLHTYFRHMDNWKHDLIKNYYEFRKNKRFQTEPEALVLGTRGKMVLSLPVPTDLADYFEAILAAVFLDSNSFETTWDVAFRVMGPDIHFYADSEIESPLHRLRSLSKKYTIGNPVNVPGTILYKVVISVEGCGQFEGFGRDGKYARHAAIMNALSKVR